MRLLIFIVSLLVLSCSDSSTTSYIYKCKIGEMEECDVGTNIGACSKPVRTCLGDGIWTSCVGQIFPSEEVCDFIDNNCDGKIDEGIRNACGSCGIVPLEICDGYDNNCNGEIDEGLSSIAEICNGLDDDCDQIIDEGLSKRMDCVPEGAGDWIVYEDTHCEMGWKECVGGSWSECYDFVPPEQEICDGIDNNCNGFIDEETANESCGTSSVGICRLGTEQCVVGEIYCVDSVNPINEVCNGLDDNCDGDVDEGLIRECETICDTGVEYCEDGDWIGCTARNPSEEVCDGIDNDCNDQVDDGILCNCSDGDMQACPANPCGWGVQICNDGFWGDCVGQNPLPETCNAFDDNCNSVIDEDLFRDCYDADIELVGIGVCEQGTSQCEMGIWQNCEDQILPSEELCDNIDNDCDGTVDNLENIFEKVDMVFIIDISGSMDIFIQAIKEGIIGFVANLEGTEHKFAIVTFGDMQDEGEPILVSNLTDINIFITNLEALGTGGGVEPSLDALYHVINPANELGISWREDATPIIVLLGDEEPQNKLPLQREDLLPYATSCGLPGCNSRTNNDWTDNDPTEIFMFLNPIFFNYWQQVIFAEGNRIFNIYDLLVEESLQEHISVLFRSVCID